MPEVPARIAEIQGVMRDTPDAYWGNEGLQAEYRTLLEGHGNFIGAAGATVAGGGLPSPRAPHDAARAIATGAAGAALVEDWNAMGGAHIHAGRVQEAAGRVVRLVTDATAFMAYFDTLPEAARVAVYAELASGLPGGAPLASEASVQRFASTPDGKALVDGWGHAAAERIGIFNTRVRYILNRMSKADGAALLSWFDGLEDDEAKAVVTSLSQ